MNSLSEPEKPVSYLPLEYREVGPLSESEDLRTSALQASISAQSTSDSSDQNSDSLALFNARLEEERTAIAAKIRRESHSEVQRIRSQINHAIEQFIQQREEYFRKAESEVVDLALAIARRILHREAQIDRRFLAGLVRYELEQLDNATKVRLTVATEMLNFWNEAVPTMPCSVEVSVDKSLTPGDVRIETELGSSTLNVERELKEIERGFFDLLAQRPASVETSSVLVQ